MITGQELLISLPLTSTSVRDRSSQLAGADLKHSLITILKLHHASKSSGRLVKTQISGVQSQSLWSVGLGWGPGIGFSQKFPGDTDVAGPTLSRGQGRWCERCSQFTRCYPVELSVMTDMFCALQHRLPSSWSVAGATETLTFSFYFILMNLNSNSHTYLMAALLNTAFLEDLSPDQHPQARALSNTHHCLYYNRPHPQAKENFLK